MVDINNYLKFSPAYANSENLGEKELKELNDKIDRLPEEIQDHLMDLGTAKTIQGLMSAHQLTEKQTVITAVLVRRVFLKDSAKNQLANNLVKYANIDPAKARSVVQYLEEKVFLTVPGPVTEPEPQQEQSNVINLKK